ncbi:response regulator [Dendrosporobacter sp. 1207_IL3150]|uniref:response regulator n=1 Tax=Dendrosporobacter sp. 1207_IL3150 TaxID=3084054 RepID=UPI002FDA9A94
MIKVLIVEDDPMVAELNRRYMEKIEGFMLKAIVNNGTDALAYLNDNHVDLVLLDVFMPGMNGLELLSAIRRQQLGTDVILVTAARDKKSIQQALRQGASDYLIKPFEFDRFLTALTDYKHRREFIENQTDFNQMDLDDQVLFKQLGGSEKNELPKGLDRHTMKRVWEYIAAAKGEFTAEEMAGLVGISQVSMRKYLKHLEVEGLLSVKINYGSVGRPTSKYQCIANKNIPAYIR